MRPVCYPTHGEGERGVKEREKDRHMSHHTHNAEFHRRSLNEVAVKYLRRARVAFCADVLRDQAPKIFASLNGRSSSLFKAHWRVRRSSSNWAQWHKRCSIVSIQLQLSHMDESAMPMRWLNDLVNATPVHSRHSIVASRREILDGSCFWSNDLRFL